MFDGAYVGEDGQGIVVMSPHGYHPRGVQLLDHDRAVLSVFQTPPDVASAPRYSLIEERVLDASGTLFRPEGLPIDRTRIDPSTRTLTEVGTLDDLRRELARVSFVSSPEVILASTDAIVLARAAGSGREHMDVMGRPAGVAPRGEGMICYGELVVVRSTGAGARAGETIRVNGSAMTTPGLGRTERSAVVCLPSEGEILVTLRRWGDGWRLVGGRNAISRRYENGEYRPLPEGILGGE